MKLFLVVLLLFSNTAGPDSVRNSDQDIDEASLFNDWLVDADDDDGLMDEDCFQAFMFSELEDENLLFDDWLVDDVDKDELFDLSEGIDDFSKKTRAARLSINRWFNIYFCSWPLDELVF